MKEGGLMARKTKERDLPIGWVYTLVSNKSGKVTKEDEPFILFSKDNFHLKYGLIREGWIQPKEFGCEIADEIYALQQWADLRRNRLFSEMGLYHVIQFENDSSCYFDYITNSLIGAHGQKNNKPINGEPVKFTNKQLALFIALTEYPRTPLDYETLRIEASIPDSDSFVSTITTHINAIRQYDSSLYNSITNANSQYTYIGNPGYWSIGNQFPREPDEVTCITLSKVFSIVESLNVLVSNTASRHGYTFHVSNMDSASVEDKFLFLIPPDFVDMEQKSETCEKLFQQNRFDSETALLNIYRHGISVDSINRLWDHLKKWISDNYQASISASGYYGMNGELPSRPSDLDAVSSKALAKAVQRICNTARDVLVSTAVAEDFFHKRNIDVGSETSTDVDVFDYIVALVLASFCYCKCQQSEAILQAKRLYREELKTAILYRFPSSNSSTTITENKEQDMATLIELVEGLEDFKKQFDKAYGEGAFEKAYKSFCKYTNDDPNSHNPTSNRTR